MLLSIFKFCLSETIFELYGYKFHQMTTLPRDSSTRDKPSLETCQQIVPTIHST